MASPDTLSGDALAGRSETEGRSSPLARNGGARNRTCLRRGCFFVPKVFFEIIARVIGRQRILDHVEDITHVPLILVEMIVGKVHAEIEDRAIVLPSRANDAMETAPLVLQPAEHTVEIGRVF